MCADVDRNIKRAETCASSRCRWRWREYSHHRLLQPMVRVALNTGVEKRIRVWRCTRPPALIESSRRLSRLPDLPMPGRLYSKKREVTFKALTRYVIGTPRLGSLLSDESLTHTGFLYFVPLLKKSHTSDLLCYHSHDN